MSFLTLKTRVATKSIIQKNAYILMSEFETIYFRLDKITPLSLLFYSTDIEITDWKKN